MDEMTIGRTSDPAKDDQQPSTNEAETEETIPEKVIETEVEDDTSEKTDNTVEAEEELEMNNVELMIKQIRKSTNVVSTRNCKGLKNLGNTCYMNSVLQCLAATIEPDIRQYLKPSNCTEELGMLLNQLRSHVPSMTSCISPNRFKMSIDSVFPQYRGSRQHDAHEFLIALLSMAKEDVSPIAGSICSFLTCNGCKYTTQSSFPFSSLDADIPSNKSSVTLMNCLEETFVEELIADGWSCSNCGKQAGARKETFLKQTPSLLIVQLKRFKYKHPGYIKDKCLVSLPQLLTLGSEKYYTQAIVDHSGSLRSGHYTARVKYGDVWLKVDDAKVSRVEAMEWNSSSAYLIFLCHVAK